MFDLAKTMIFNEQESLELMRCLEDLAFIGEINESNSDNGARWNVLRLALLRNLARSQLRVV